MYSKQKCILCPSAEEMRGLAACPKIQKSKNPSFQTESLDSGQKDGFLDFPRFFWIFLDSSKGCLEKMDFWIFGLEKSILRFLQKSKKNPSFPLGFLLFLKNQSFSLRLGNPKIQTPFRRISKKTLGNPKIHLFDLNPKILFEKMDFWIFG